MSKAPGGNVREYDGTGEWFKIFELGVEGPSAVNSTLERPWHWVAMYNDTVRIFLRIPGYNQDIG